MRTPKEVSLKIYTVSGHLIRTFNDSDLAGSGYREVPWDGNDTMGDEVANGVYFYELKGEGNGSIQRITGKVAKIR